jgi:hypothetical protein
MTTVMRVFNIRTFAARLEERKPSITTAYIRNVKELSLTCSADADRWKEYLEQYGLRPTVKEGKVSIVIAVNDLAFIGIRFQEVTISISVQNPDTSSEYGSVFLLTAYNSNRFFAWFEKKILSTPFRKGKIVFETEKYSEAELFESGVPLLRLHHAPEPSRMFRIPKIEGHETWKGTVFFPDNVGPDIKRCKCFRASLAGWGRRIEFRPEIDSLMINEWKGNCILGLLRESNIRGQEWFIRTNSQHWKSLTYRYDTVENGSR